MISASLATKDYLEYDYMGVYLKFMLKSERVNKET